MVSVLKCHPTRQPTGTVSGSKPATYNARWGLELDDQVDMFAALVLAVGAEDPFIPVPGLGSFFSWTSPGVGGLFVRTVDKSAIALDFTMSHFLDDGKKWNIDVRWRQPTSGAWEEPDRVNVTPINRRPYYWIEYYTETEEIFDARNRIDIGTSPFERTKFTPGPITTAAGEEVDLSTDERLHMVLVAEKLVESPTVAKTINSSYFGLINNNLWKLPVEFQSLPGGPLDEDTNALEFHARFLRAETTQYPEWFDHGKTVKGSPKQYFKMQSRVRIGILPFFKQVPNRGTWKYESSESKVILHRDDDGVLGKVNLKSDGTEDTSNVPFLIPYQIAGDRKFDNQTLGFV